MFKNYKSKRTPQFMIIPMIDIIFFLLVFFMMNSMQTVAQKALAVQLPQASNAQTPTQMPVIITLDEEGHITMDNKPVTIDDHDPKNGGKLECSRNFTGRQTYRSRTSCSRHGYVENGRCATVGGSGGTEGIEVYERLYKSKIFCLVNCRQSPPCSRRSALYRT